MTMVYKWKSRASIPVDPQVAGETLEGLRVRNNGQLTPRAVVDEASAEDSPLHPAFEWDDDAAAAAYREDQARYLLRSITVTVQDQEAFETPVRAFVTVRQDDSAAYTSIGHAMSDQELRQQVLQRAWQELEAFRQRYHDFEELALVVSAIDRVESRISA